MFIYIYTNHLAVKMPNKSLGFYPIHIHGVSVNDRLDHALESPLQPGPHPCFPNPGLAFSFVNRFVPPDNHLDNHFPVLEKTVRDLSECGEVKPYPWTREIVVGVFDETEVMCTRRPVTEGPRIQYSIVPLSESAARPTNYPTRLWLKLTPESGYLVSHGWSRRGCDVGTCPTRC